MNTEQIDILLAKHFAHETTEEEELRLKDWISDNREEYVSLKVLWADTHDAPAQQTFDTHPAWEKVAPRIGINTEGSKKSIIWRPNYWMAAASVFLIAGAGLLFYFNSSVQMTTIAGQVKRISLDDGSVITLNGSSTITYPRYFGSNREVKLTGEAYFEVKHDAQHPFKVRANRLLVHVLGTSFLVKTEGQLQRVVVNTGKVAVKDEQSGQSAVLIKDEAVSISGGNIVKDTVTGENYLAWKTGKLNFNDVPLNQVFNDLEDFYQVTISVKGENVNLCRVTTAFEHQSLDNALMELSRIFGFTYQIEGKKVFVSGVVCR